MSWNVLATPGTPGERSILSLRLWPALAIGVTLLSLFAAYFLVVRDITKSGELRRAAVVAHSDAMWRCQSIPGRAARESCMRELNGDNGRTLTLVSAP